MPSDGKGSLVAVTQASGQAEKAPGVVDIPEILPFRDDREIWERQHGEGNKPWYAFCIYRDMLPYQRTYRAVQRQLQEETGASAYVIVSQWAHYFRWDERAVAWDNYVQAKEQQELVQQRIQARKETAALGRMLRGKAQEALEVLTTTLYIERVNPETGEVERKLKADLSPNEIARLAEVGTKLERLSLGMDQEEGSTPAGTHLELNLTIAGSRQQASDAEIMASAAEILKAREQQAQIIDGIAKETQPGGVQAEG